VARGVELGTRDASGWNKKQARRQPGHETGTGGCSPEQVDDVRRAFGWSVALARARPEPWRHQVAGLPPIV
jgi:hypothetical protein